MDLRRDPIRRHITGLLRGASDFTDVQINVAQPLRVRTSSGLLPMDEARVTDADLGVFLGSLHAGDDWNARLDAGGGHVDFGAVIDGARFRCNLYRFNGGLRALSLRKLFAPIPSLAELGLPPVVASLAQQSRGLLLFTGPTGAGKSTSLAAIIQHINATRPYHIVTVEEPIEYEFAAQRSVISQREIGRDCQSYAGALRAAVRQHPDVILIGEIRDFETMRTAMAAAGSGHLVLATMHTPGAARTVERIVSLYPGAEQLGAQQQLASVLIGIVSQVLVEATDRGTFELAYEILVNTPGVQGLLYDGMLAQLEDVMRHGAADGMNTLNQVLACKVLAGQIHARDARFYAYDPQGLATLLGDGDAPVSPPPLRRRRLFGRSR